VIRLRYEDIKADAARELRRVVDFLLGPNVAPDEKVACAVRSSAMETLQEQSSKYASANHAALFFGSRGLTEAAEDLDFPAWLIGHFESIGMFSMAQNLGYADRAEKAFVMDRSRRRMSDGAEGRTREL